jgi:membrane-anchored glycerophosphoryl diester phosphodiesterase (GDPDase)
LFFCGHWLLVLSSFIIFMLNLCVAYFLPLTAEWIGN